ncbi:hypothetical protein RYX36_036000 [Vicia faba]
MGGGIWCKEAEVCFSGGEEVWHEIAGVLTFGEGWIRYGFEECWKWGIKVDQRTMGDEVGRKSEDACDDVYAKVGLCDGMMK